MISSSCDRLLTGSPLRRSGTGRAIIFVLLAILAFATLVHLSVFAGLKPELVAVFGRALGLSTLLAAVPVTLLWFLDRREREAPFLFAAAFLWGGCIATALALPFNNVAFRLVEDFLAQNPALAVLLGPDAALMIVAPLSAPIVEEIAKALGVVLLFWLLRPEFDNMRDGLVYGALIGVGFTWFETALYVTLFETEIAQAVIDNVPTAPITVTIDRKGVYDSDDMKVQVDGDRLLAIAKTLQPEIVDGESIGFLRFTAEGAELFRDTVERAMRRPEGLKQWYLSVIDGLAKATGNVGVFSIEGKAWGEMDFPADVKRNERMTSAWLRPGEFSQAAEAG